MGIDQKASSAVDVDAIHDNVAGEIAAIAEKASPVNADLVLIEDSEDADNKKRVQVGNLPGGGGGSGTVWEDLVPSGNAPSGADDDEFDDASIDAAWVQVTPTGTVTWVEDHDAMSVLCDGVAAADMPSLVKPFSLTAPVTIKTAMRVFGGVNNNGTHGLIFSDGTTDTSNCLFAGIQEASDGNRWIARGGTFTDLNTTVFNTITNKAGHYPWIHLHFTWVSANTWRLEMSAGGIQVVSYDADGSFTLDPTHFGLTSSNWGNSKKTVVDFAYFRVS